LHRCSRRSSRREPFSARFCTPGLLVAAHDLLARDPAPADADVREALAGNLCRCTGYEKILEAVRLAGERLAADRQAGERLAGERQAGERQAGERQAGEGA
jgi:carbon-monoxide dehydrogenase small subunit